MMEKEVTPTYQVTTPCQVQWAGISICTISMIIKSESSEDAVDYAHYLIHEFCRGVIPGYGWAEEVKKK